MLFTVCFTFSAVAQRYWDINGSSSGASSGNTAPGTWGVNNFWSTSSTGNANTGGWTSGQQAVFSAGGNATGTFTVTVSGNQTASGIVFSEGTVTLSGGNLTLTSGVGDGTIEVDSPNIATISSQISGGGGLAKTGSGSLLLSGTNNFSGVTDLRQGTLFVSKPSSLGSSMLDMDGGTFAGSGAAVALNNDVVISEDSVISGLQNLTFSGRVSAEGGARTLTINNTGQTLFTGATLSLGDQNKRGTLTLDISGGPVTIANVIQNGVGARPDGLVKDGDGTLTLTGNNTFTGPLQLNEGTLFLGNDSAAGAGRLVLGDGVTIAATSGPRTISNSLNINGDVTFGGTDSLTFLDSFNLGDNRTFTVLNTTIFNGKIGGGDDSLTKAGAGTLVLNGDNSFGGSGSSLSVNAGMVALGDNSAVGRNTTTLLLNGGAVEAINGPRILVNPVVIANDSTIGGSSNLTFSGSVNHLAANHTLSITNSALTTFSGATFTLASSNAPASLTLDIAGSSGGTTISSLIQNGVGAGSLTKNGSGALTLGGSGANTFSGGLTVNAGTVTAAKVNALGTGALAVNNAILNLGTYNQTVGPVTLAGGTINGTSARLTGSSYQMQSGTVNVALIGSGALTKSTAGILTLAGANTYTGGTVINAGTALINNSLASSAGNGLVTVNNSGTLGGIGNITDQITLNTGGILSPGITGPGTLSTASQIWNVGAKFIVEMKDTQGGEGIGWDLLKITGSLNARGAAGNPLFVDLRSLALNGSAGAVFDFTNTLSYSWRIVSTTGGIVFNAGQNVGSAFSLLTANFNNAIGSGHFNLAVANGNKDLVLTYTPGAVPEPGVWTMISLGFFVLLVRGWSHKTLKR